PAFFRHVLERFDPTRDLHFQTRTTIDTLDYSGSGLNEGSKLVLAAAGPKRRALWTELPGGFSLPRPMDRSRLAMPGVLAVEAPPFVSHEQAEKEIETWARALEGRDLDGLPLLVLCDDAGFTGASLENLLWVAFTRSNPSHDVHGVGSFIEHKHWGCTG